MADKKLDLLDLVRLQYLENAILKRLGDIKKLKDNQELKELEGEFEKIEERFQSTEKELSEVEHERKKLEDTIELQTEKIKSNKEKLFSGTITSSKELENYQEEIEILTKRNEELEDKELGLMMIQDDKAPVLDELKQKRDESKKKMDELKEKIEDDIKKVQQEISDIKEKRQDIAKKIPKEKLKEYQDIRNKKGGIAVAVLKDGFCSACNMQLSPIDLEEITEPDVLYKCPLCSRILIVYREEIENISSEF